MISAFDKNQDDLIFTDIQTTFHTTVWRALSPASGALAAPTDDEN